MVAGLGAWLGWFLGSYDGFIYALVALVTIDCKRQPGIEPHDRQKVIHLLIA